MFQNRTYHLYQTDILSSYARWHRICRKIMQPGFMEGWDVEIKGECTIWFYAKSLVCVCQVMISLRYYI